MPSRRLIHRGDSIAGQFSVDSDVASFNRRMGRMAPEILIETAAIAQLEQLILQLPSQARVRITTHAGSVISGTVTERPTMQLFKDASGAEGVNSVLRLDDPQAPPWTTYLWLSDIGAIEHLDTGPHAT